MLVHVIKSSGTRFEYSYRDGTPVETILAELASIKKQFGFNGTVKRPDPDHPALAVVDFGDEASGYAWDNPETIVTILSTTKIGGIGREARDVAELDAAGVPIELRRLKGPELSKQAKPPEPAPEPRAAAK